MTQMRNNLCDPWIRQDLKGVIELRVGGSQRKVGEPTDVVALSFSVSLIHKCTSRPNRLSTVGEGSSDGSSDKHR